MKYKTISNTVEAFQLTRMNTKGAAWPKWLVDAWTNYGEPNSFYSEIEYMKGDKHNKVTFYILDGAGSYINVNFNDYILCDQYGRLSVLSKKDFENTFQADS